MKKPRLDLRGRLIRKRLIRIFKLLILAAVGLFLVHILVNVTVRLPANSAKPVDGVLVLGGSIKREIYAAQLANQNPELPFIISQGSEAPCLWLIFQREDAPKNKVWLEQCSRSTFDNFFFCVTLLRQWGVHKVKLITSESHLPRAKWLAQIHLGALGMAVEVDPVQETGVPGNQESTLKTSLDVARSLIWGVFSQIIKPPCFDIISLADVNMADWEEKGFVCEHQGEIDDSDSSR